MNIREASRKPPRSAPQLLSIPNRDAVIAAFKRACTADMTLLDIELETHQSLAHGPGYKLVAFIKEHKLNAQHMMPGGRLPDEHDLQQAATMLAQSLSIGMRRKAAERENGRGRAA